MFDRAADFLVLKSLQQREEQARMERERMEREQDAPFRKAKRPDR